MSDRTSPRVAVRAMALLVGAAFKADAPRAALVLGLAPVVGAVAAVTAVGLQRMVNSAVEADLPGMLTAALILAGALVAGQLAGTVAADLRIRLQQRVGLLLDQRIMAMTSGLPHLDHHEYPPYQDQLELLRSHRTSLGSAFGALVENLRALVAFGSTVALLMSVRPEFLLLLLLALPTVLAVRRGERATARAEETTVAPARLRQGLFTTACSPGAAKELRVFGLQEEIAARHRALWEQVDRPRRQAEVRTGMWTSVGWLIFGAGFAGALYLVVTAALRGQASPGDVVLTIALGGQLTGSVSGLIQMLSWMQKTLRAMGYYLWLDDHARARIRPREAGAPAPAAGSDLVLENVSFSYPDAARPVLRDVSLRLPAGRTVAVVGENGAGKTTLVKLLCRLYDPTAGRITYGGSDLADYDVQAWRDRVTACFQDFCRLEFLLQESAGIGDLPRIDDEPAVMDALDRAGASALPGLLPHGLRTQLGPAFPGGTDLSGGQWQKVALTRSIMRDAPILRVLDEPAASLDPASEYEIFRRFQLAAGQTENGTITVFVSHRFATVRTADLIVVLDGGTIRELGSHAELMALDGLYATLYRLHAKGYEETKPSWTDALDKDFDDAPPVGAEL
ncbi:ABC transporter ATP-binding protein [Nonomuraea jabiensis]|uniref:ATP-binding cassette subfamily B protein n=1 Tax=Nonomuraea jabiensis TaxID=882448 RepID=A0A7W9G8R7_9ACTN|nr:ABC transporter ATP-binding protein [Nonomuraea jabiensis]MBB5779228.1 ATP-binding cassette subfamily B protein [Nonomuraea jabiensis]